MENNDEIKSDLKLYNFSDIIGNITPVSLVKKAIIRGKFPKLAIMAGYPGTGKSTTADIAGMALTCLEPVEGNPCMHCRNCIENIKALATTGQSKNLIKKNLGKLNDKKDVAEIINEIFVLQAPTGTNVYELGEAHCWDANAQTALLEEIDRLDANTIIIITTTKASKLIPELRSRTICFNFNRLNKTESKLLFDRTCAKLGINKVSKELEQMVIKYGRGIPRDMVNIIDFIKNVEPSMEEIKAFLNIIDYNLFTDLIQNMVMSLKDTVLLVDYMFNTYSCDMVIEQFKNYFVDVMFYITGDIQGSLSKEDCAKLKSFLTPDIVYRVSKLIQEMVSYNNDEADVKMQFLKIRQAVANKKIGNVVTENSKNAASQHVKATRLYNENKNISEESKKAESSQLDKDKLRSMLQIDKEIKNDDYKLSSQQSKKAADRRYLGKADTDNSNKPNSKETKDMHAF